MAKFEIKEEGGAPATPAEYKRLVTELGTAVEAFKTAHKTELDEVKKGLKDVVTQDKLVRINDAITELETKKASIDEAFKSYDKRLKDSDELREELEMKFNKLRLKGQGEIDATEMKAVALFNKETKGINRQNPEQDVEAFRAYKKSFDAYMRKGEKLMTADEHKAMQVGVDTDGGVMVPSDSSGRLVAKVYELSPIRQISASQSISSDRLEGIEVIGEAGAGWVGEVSSRTETSTPNLGKYEIVAQEQYAAPRATQKMIDDATVDVESWLADQVASKFARYEGAAFVTGTGVGQPRGFTTYTTAATGDATRTWGTIEHVASGASGDFGASTPADKLFDLVYAFKPAYLANATWVTSRSVMAKIRKFKETTTNAYLWQPGLQQGQPSQLLGFPLVNAEDMPVLAANSLSLAFGDFKQAYQIVDRLGTRTLRDPYTAKPYVIFYTIKRVGGAVINFEAIKFMKFA